MTEALAAALGIALSPFAVIPAVLLLFTPRPAAASSGFAAGWAAGIALVTGLAVLLGDLLTLPDAPPRWATVTRIVLGAVLVGFGLARFRRRPGGSEPPGWLTSLESASPASTLRFGFVASAPNPKVALLALAGGLSIGTSTTGGWREVLAVLGFAAVAASSSMLPVAAYLLLGERALVPLGRVKDWLTRHIDAALAVVAIVIGLLLLQKGFSSW
jgi:threonine/homoserine/homoserine lactone efflux protein